MISGIYVPSSWSSLSIARLESLPSNEVAVPVGQNLDHLRPGVAGQHPEPVVGISCRFSETLVDLATVANLATIADKHGGCVYACPLQSSKRKAKDFFQVTETTAALSHP